MSKIENFDQSYSLKKIDKETINIKVHNNDKMNILSKIFLKSLTWNFKTFLLTFHQTNMVP